MLALGRFVTPAVLVFSATLSVTACAAPATGKATITTNPEVVKTAAGAPATAKVTITTNPEVVRRCTFVGQVQGVDHWGGGFREGAAAGAEAESVREVKTRAAAMGADTVLLVTSTTGSASSQQRADAYRCSAAAPSR